ncbi:MAG: 3-dehydroquinate synthase [Flavobacteriales bacterium]|jgi:3-dehydroquinate synthase
MEKQIVKKKGSIYCNGNAWACLQTAIHTLNPTKIFILVDANTQKYCLPSFLRLSSIDALLETITIPVGETNKTINTCTLVWSILAKKGADRNSLLINLGGGVVTDLGGFVASTFKRGIEFINIPTSLLAMVDASIGGKNGVDLGVLKNQVGIINNPLLVLIDTSFLSTLPEKEVTSGYAEMLKHGLIHSETYWNQLQSFDVANVQSTENLIWNSIEIKNTIVTEDPNELGVRKLLNYGHTLGHAIESFCLEQKGRIPLLHGEAIAIGMILATFISGELLHFDKNKQIAITTLVLKHFEKKHFSTREIDAIIGLLKFDKKNQGDDVLFVLLEDFGKFKINQKVSNELIYSAFMYYQDF